MTHPRASSDPPSSEPPGYHPPRRRLACEPSSGGGAASSHRPRPRPTPRLDPPGHARCSSSSRLARRCSAWLSLGRPLELVFDEIFYARDACWYVVGNEAVCGITDLASRTHPPLGKWLIGAGIAAFGYEPTGWRDRRRAGRHARRAAGLPPRLAPACAAGAEHGGHGRRGGGGGPPGDRLAPSRAFARRDAGRVHRALRRRRRAGDRARPRPSARSIGSAVVVAARRSDGRGAWWPACSSARRPPTKWSGAYVAPAVIGLVVAWEILERRRADPEAGWRAWIVGAFRREALPTIVLLGLVPMLVYVASYTGRMPGELMAAPWDPASVWNGIWQHQRAMLDFHTELGGRPSVPVAALVVAAPPAPGGVLVQRRGRHVSRDPGDGEPGRVVAGRGRARGAGRHVVRAPGGTGGDRSR